MKTRYVLAAVAGVATLATGAGIAAAQTDDGTLTDTVTPSTVDDGTDSTVTTPEADDTTDDGTDGTAPSGDSSSSDDAKEGCGDRAGDGGGRGPRGDRPADGEAPSTEPVRDPVHRDPDHRDPDHGDPDDRQRQLTTVSNLLPRVGGARRPPGPTGASRSRSEIRRPVPPGLGRCSFGA